MYGKNVPQDYFDNAYNGYVDDEQDAYDLRIWTTVDDMDLDME